MKTLLCIISSLLMISATAQLVNPGFEGSSSYPINTGQWQVVDGWNNAASLVASPDYYHYMGSTAADLPETPLAIVEPSEGDALMGLIVCGRKHTNLREYLTAELSAPMEVGKRYRVTFKITNGDRTSVSTAGLGARGIGLFFSTSQPVQEAEQPLMVTPQFTIDHVLYSEEWEYISLTIEATAPWLFMTFGLFGNDDDKEIIAMDGNDPAYAYYFLDDFQMTKLPGGNTPGLDPGDKEEPGHVIGDLPFELQPFFIPNTFTPNGDGHNDLFKPVAGTVTEWEFSVFSRWGERVFFTTDESQGWDGFYNSLPGESGGYVWEVRYREFSDENGWEERELRGIVSLVR